jgi:hypothetical protein
MSAARVPIFIKIKYNQATRKVTVPDYPPPVWAKLAAAITDRFAIPDSQSIALQYLDSDGDLITMLVHSQPLHHLIRSMSLIGVLPTARLRSSSMSFGTR